MTRRFIAAAISKAFLITVCAVISSQNANATPTWLNKVTAATGGRNLGPYIGSDGAGNATVVFDNSTLTQFGPHTNQFVTAKHSFRPVKSNSFLAPLSFSTGNKIDSLGTEVYQDVELAVAPNGAAIAVWEHTVTNNSARLPSDPTNSDVLVVEAAYRNSGASEFSPFQKLTFADQTPWQNHGDDYDGTALAAIDDAGNAIVVWINRSAPTYPATSVNRSFLFYATHGANAAGFDSPVEIVEARDLTPTKVAYNIAASPAGEFAVVWTKVDPSFNQHLMASVRPVGSVFSLANQLNRTEDGVQYPAIAAARNNEFSVAWLDFDGTPANEAARIAVSSKPFGGAWTPFQKISSNLTDASPQFIGASYDGHNNLALLWFQESGGIPTTIAPTASVRISPGSIFSAPQALAAPGVYGGSANEIPVVAGDYLGRGVAMWHRGTNPDFSLDNYVETAVRFTDSTSFLPAIKLDGPFSGAPALSVDEEGNYYAAWVTGGNYSNNVISSVLDWAGPSLFSAKIPDTAQVGEIVNFSVPSVDRWSEIGDTTWDFGDDTQTQVGAAVSHKYLRAGTFTVTLNGSDIYKNASTTSRLITVTDGSNPPGNGPGTNPADQIISGVKNALGLLTTAKKTIKTPSGKNAAKTKATNKLISAARKSLKGALAEIKTQIQSANITDSSHPNLSVKNATDATSLFSKATSKKSDAKTVAKSWSGLKTLLLSMAA